MKRKIIAVLFIVASLCFRAVAADLSPPVPAAVEKAVLAEDWAKVAEIIGEVKPDTPAPLRLIMGHACLALDRYNDAYTYFAATLSSQALEAWHNYAAGFREKHRESAAAGYFDADSLARRELYEKAIAALPSGGGPTVLTALVLNMKGVCLARLGKYTDARKCFELASAHRCTTTDALVNLGMVKIQESDAMEGARNCFQEALSRAPDNALALHGLALIELLKGNRGIFNSLSMKAASILPMYGVLFAYNRFLFDREMANRMLLLDEQQAKTSGTHFNKGFSEANRAIDNYNSSPNYFNRMEAGGKLAQLGRSGELDAWAKSASPERLAGAAKATKEMAGQDAGKADFWKNAGFGSGALAAGAGVASVAPGPHTPYAAGLNKIASAASFAEIAVGNQHGKWRVEHEQNFKIIEQNRDNKPPMTTHPGGKMGVPQTPSGGANLEMSQAVWDDGNWPFIPVYGLGYGMTSVQADMPAAATSTPDTKNEEGDGK